MTRGRREPQPRPLRGPGQRQARDGDERDGMPVENLDEPREIRQRPGQPVDLVDHDDVDPPGLDVGEQPRQGRPHQPPDIGRGPRPAVAPAQDV